MTSVMSILYYGFVINAYLKESAKAIDYFDFHYKIPEMYVFSLNVVNFIIMAV